MTDLKEAQNVLPGLKTDDIFRTSYGVGHHWRPGFYFPDSVTQTKLNQNLTCNLRPGTNIKPEEHFETTNNSAYNHKIAPEAYRNHYNPPPPHFWDVNYLNDFRSRYLSGGYRRPLSPSHQLSEMKDEYQALSGPTDLWRPLGMQPFELCNHHKDGPSKKIIASSENPDLAGRIVYPKDKEVLRHLDPYLSVTMKDHRMWSPEELNAYAKSSQPDLDVKQSAPKERPPMRDTTVFRERTDHTRVRPLSFAVPHSGFETVYGADYKQPSSILQREGKLCPIETPFALPDPASKSAFAAPLMYKTEYSTIGECQRNLL